MTWKRISDELPPLENLVVFLQPSPEGPVMYLGLRWHSELVRGDSYVSIGACHWRHGQWVEIEPDEPFEPTHWHPLPEPPEIES